MFWSHPNPWAKSITGPSAEPVTVTLFLLRTSIDMQYRIPGPRAQSALKRPPRGYFPDMVCNGASRWGELRG
jgi:hypothetical protein